MVFLSVIRLWKPKSKLKIHWILIQGIKNVLLFRKSFLGVSDQVGSEVKTWRWNLFEKVVGFKLAIFKLKIGANWRLWIDLDESVIRLRAPFLTVNDFLPVVWYYGLDLFL